jgi:hypothetical protein
MHKMQANMYGSSGDQPTLLKDIKTVIQQLFIFHGTDGVFVNEEPYTVDTIIESVAALRTTRG